MNTILKGAGAIVATAAFTVSAVFAIDMAAGMPDVHESYSTGECVKVINYAQGDNYSCENMPKKFNHVWVQ